MRRALAIASPIGSTALPQCHICLQPRTSLKFKTRALAICAYCVNSLNKTKLSAADAERKWLQTFHHNYVASKPETASWAESWIEKRREELIKSNCADAKALKYSAELKVLRAHRKGLISREASKLPYPKRWNFIRYRIKHRDDYRCNVCQCAETNEPLHVHHIVFRSRSGTHNYRNLVTLCAACHQRQHSHDLGSTSAPATNTDDQLHEELLANPAQPPAPTMVLTATPHNHPRQQHWSKKGWVRILILLGLMFSLAAITCMVILYELWPHLGL